METEIDQIRNDILSIQEIYKELVPDPSQYREGALHGLRVALEVIQEHTEPQPPF